jgi:hypothetical protein
MGSSAMVKLPRDVSTRACGGGVAMLVVAPGGGIGCAIAADSPNAAAARLIGNRRAMINLLGSPIPLTGECGYSNCDDFRSANHNNRAM